MGRLEAHLRDVDSIAYLITFLSLASNQSCMYYRKFGMIINTYHNYYQLFSFAPIPTSKIYFCLTTTAACRKKFEPARNTRLKESRRIVLFTNALQIAFAGSSVPTYRVLATSRIIQILERIEHPRRLRRRLDLAQQSLRDAIHERVITRKIPAYR